MAKRGYDAADMQRMYGDFWNMYVGILTCPHCNSDLRDRALGTPFKREINVVDRVLDRVIKVVCPDCDGTIMDVK